MMAAATFILSLVMKRSPFGARTAYLGHATALLDVAGGYPYVIGPIPTFVCGAAFAGWSIAVGWRLLRIG
jgi:hypothetical protein